MGRDRLEKLREKAPESISTGFLQLDGYSCTKVREAMAALMENNRRAYTIPDLIVETDLSRASLYRNLPILLKKRLVHFSPTLNAYFCCQKLFKSKGRLATTCHSFAVCQTCKHVEEFIHTKHAHPKLRHIKNLKTDHEWLGLCSDCDRP